ncbi:hypothetical protein [Actinoallomurus iriomotensis]|uniref:Peptidase C14 n=1 Tax=Actinoallomurus iriomotensis TaxID=478107 RepID=A0A9W6VUW2_9ACTN|nr:hypothetical protein [Actinoallomurus iriomotensis]GLY79101.1 hypothetical protein Airi01_073680 [Actinoallomurus iriomotensis]
MERRHILRATGAAAGLVTFGSLLAADPASADPAHPLKQTVQQAGTIAELLRLEVRGLEDGLLVQVAGYRAPGDGGGMLLRWDATSTLPANGGTVLAPPGTSKGRWRQIHHGVADFRRFGIFDDKIPADTALEAMVTDPAIHRIEAHTDLHFVKRHTFHRSDIELDFGGNTVSTDGIEKAGEDDPFAAVLLFRGKVTDTVVTHKLSATMPELSDVFEVGDSSKFAVGQWWSAEVNQLSGRWERELQKLLQVTQIVDGDHIRVDYKNGWELAAGRTITWTRIEPVERAHVRNMVFTGAGDDQYTGSHPVAYEYTVSCDVSGIDATGTFWPVIMRRWCTHFRTEQCSLKNPPTVSYGGAGYLTQQIYCLYGHVSDCHTANARHLNDLTASAYCYVENCHGDGDDEGPFVTHGQYEHDLVYTGNSGLMTFANSGAAWGSAAKRITVRKHVCSWFVARVSVTDLTLEDVRVIGKAGLQGSGMIWVNADGVQMRGCSASDTLIISQASNRSGRPNVIDGCTFALPAKSEIVQANVTAPVHVSRSVLTGLDGNAFNGTGELRLVDTILRGRENAEPVTCAAATLVLDGCTVTGTGVRLAGKADQRIRLGGGTEVTGTGTLLSRADAAGTITWELTGYRSLAGDAGTAHIALSAGKNRYSAVGALFNGGRLELRDGAFGDGSYLKHAGNVENGVTRTALPKDGAGVQTTGNLVM